MFKFIRSLFVVLLNFSVTGAFSQITVSPASGCAPLSVQLSGPAGATNVYWNLGSAGTTTLSNPNPIFSSAGNVPITYTAIVNGSPVTYTATITVGNPPSGSFSYVMPASHCVPMTVNFSAQGGSPGSTVSWAFGDLSPVVNGNSVSHTYQFSNSFAPVAIITDAVSGCTAVANNTSGNLIHVSALPNVVIASSAGYIGCVPPFVTSLDGSGSSTGSPLGGNLTFNWQISGGTPGGSSLPTPGPVSFVLGNHQVLLTATDNNFCSHTGTVVISVVNPTLTANIAPTVCVGALVNCTVNSNQPVVNFNISSVGLSSHTVVPNVNQVIQPLCQFLVPGQQQVVISVQASAICPAFSVLKPVFVESVTANFNGLPPLTSCNPTMLATYVNLSTVNSSSPLSFTWFPSWGFNASWNASPTTAVTSSTTQNVTFTLSQGSNNPYTIFNLFNPVITLYAESPNGCSGTATLPFHTLSRPNARFNKVPREGCAPLVVTLRDTSYTSVNYPITTWNWSSGTTPPVLVNNQQIVVFTYTAPGVYLPTLTVSTANGCTDVFQDSIIVSLPPSLSAVMQSSACAGVPVTIAMSGTSNTTPPGNVNHWHATSDNGFFSGCVTNASPSFPFSHTGTHTLSVTGYDRGCVSTSVIPLTINISGPYGKFVFTTHCAGDKKIVDFNVHLQDCSGGVLNFGDGSPVVNINGVLNGNFFGAYTHTYSASGDYNVTLTSSKSGGVCAPRTFTRVVKIRQPVARITWGSSQIPALPQALACTKTRYNFNGLTSTENTVSCKSGYKWWFQSPTYELPPMNCNDGYFQTHAHPGPITHIVDAFALDTFRAPGIYTLSLEVTDLNGCTDTATKIFRIGNAIPVFTFVSNPVCLSAGSVQIINTTPASLVPPDVITSYTWSFGDGNTVISNNPNFNPQHLYLMVPPPSQTFQVMAIAKNQMNCIDTTIHVLQINNPMTGFYSPTPIVCIPKGQPSNSANFQAMQGYSTYSFSTGSPTANPTWQSMPGFTNIATNYFTPGIYTPTLIVIDAAGCKATDQITITANGQPTASIKNLGASGFCVPAKLLFKDSTAIFDTPLSGYQWNIGTITSPLSPADSILENIFTTPGIFTVNLIVYAGTIPSCPSTAAILVHVFDTRAELEIDKTIFCLGDEITVKAINLNDVYSWKWFFGDLVPQPTIYNTPFATNPVTYKYDTYPTNTTDGKTIITLKAVSDNQEGCVRTETIAVQVIKIDADFMESSDNYRHCLNLVPDTFVSTTPNPLTLNYIISWEFGDGKLGGGAIAPHTYTSAGVYPVTYKVRDADYACKASAVKHMTILPLPKASIVVSDSLVCPKDTFIVTVSGSSEYAGQLTGYFTPASNSVIPLPVANSYSFPLTTSVTTKYGFSVIDTNRCEAPLFYKWVDVPLAPPEIHTATTVVIGQPIELNAAVTGSFSYQWIPEIRFLSDTLIPNPVSTSLADITYSVIVRDEPLQCWAVQSTYSIIVLPYSSVDVPSAFTPNADGINDVIFPDGWGIKKLIYFRVFNRWGQLLFETSDYRKGWDGIFQGVPQNMETYVYQTEIETYLESPSKVTKQGTFKLIR